MKIVIEDTDLHLIADDILSCVRMLELADEDTIQDDIDFYLPKIRIAAEDLNSKASPAETDKTDGTNKGRSGEAEQSEEGTELPGKDLQRH